MLCDFFLELMFFNSLSIGVGEVLWFCQTRPTRPTGLTSLTGLTRPTSPKSPPLSPAVEDLICWFLKALITFQRGIYLIFLLQHLRY